MKLKYRQSGGVCNLFVYLTIEHYKSLKIQLLSPSKPLKFYYFMKSMEILTKLGNVFVISTAITTILKINYCIAAARFGEFMSVCYQCIREKTGAQNIVQEIKQYQKKWLQHVQRMDTNRMTKQALRYRPKGRRNIGRPKKRWRDQLHFEDQGTGNTHNPSGTWWWWWWWVCVTRESVPKVN